MVSRWFAPAVLWAVVGVCCALPLGWMALQVIRLPGWWGEIRLPVFRAMLLGQTLLYNGGAALLATALALPGAIAIGRGRGGSRRLLMALLPLSLLMPSICYAYGWTEALRLVGIELYPGGAGDVLRCIWSLGAWLWPIPAVGMGMALRGMDHQVQQHALLDGGLWRVTLREMAPAAAACAAAVAVLAMQEFAVYEPTSISVVATELRSVFTTGALSTAGALPMSGSPAQEQRAAAVVLAGLPLLAIVAGLALVIVRYARRTAGSSGVSLGDWPRLLDAPRAMLVAAWAVLAITSVLPVAAMVLSLKRPVRLEQVMVTFGPHAAGSMLIGAMAGAAAAVLGAAACAHRSRLAMALALATFLVGGPLLAIADIRLFNRATFWGIPVGWIYNGPVVVVMAHVARFGWLGLLAGEAAWSRPIEELRHVAALDGAGRLRMAVHVLMPLLWPLIAAAGGLVMVLSLTEVSATALLQPLNPPMLVNLLLTWAHMPRYDDMLAGSLLLIAMAALVGVLAVLLGRWGMRWLRPAGALVLTGVLLVAGCDSGKEPRAIWCSTGEGPGQVVYPRAIAYSPKDDTFFVVDREAHVQRLDRQGRCLAEWRTPNAADGKPVGLSVGPDGNLYVADTHYFRVLVYSPSGQLLRQWGSRGTGPGQFIFLTDVAFDSAGNVYVSEYGDHDRIQVFDAAGNYLREFGRPGNGPGEFSRPQSMVIDGTTLYVADACNHRIEVFKTDGTFVRSIGRVGSAPGEFRYPYGMDRDSDGMLIVCEFGNSRVQKIDPATGRCLGTWGTPGHQPGQLAYPWAVAVDRDDRVVVADSGNNRLQVFDFQ